MVRKYQRKAINIFLLAAMLLAALTSSCSGDDKDSIKVDYAALENIRIISEGYYVFPPPVTYDMLDIEVDSSGLLYIADKDKVLRINPEKQQYEEFIIGLGYCRKILVVQDKFFILDQGNEKSILKIYNLKGSILNEIELEYNVVKMQPIDSKGETIALLIIDENQNKKITLLETESREITSLDFTNIISFCTYQKNKLCIVTRGGPYTLEIYDAENRNIITSTALNISHIADIAYSEKNKTIYYLTSEDIGTIDPETGIVKTIRQLDFSNMKA